MFATYLAQSTTWTTVRSYLSAIRFYQIQSGLPDPSLSPCPKLPYVLKGIRKSSHAAGTNHRLPLTPDHLRKIHSTWSQQPITFNKTMLWAAFCMGFFGFMRSGEFTSTVQDNELITSVSISDVSIDSRTNPQVLTIYVRRSKTDQFSEGKQIHLGRTGNDLCPVSAILAYLAVRPRNPGPLFVYQDGSPLSRRQLVTQLRSALSEAGIDTTGFSGHSFRIGAATTAASAGLSDSLIQRLGRWKSDAFKSYIRKNSKEIAAVTARLAN